MKALKLFFLFGFVVFSSVCNAQSNSAVDKKDIDNSIFSLEIFPFGYDLFNEDFLIPSFRSVHLKSVIGSGNKGILVRYERKYNSGYYYWYGFDVDQWGNFQEYDIYGTVESTFNSLQIGYQYSLPQNVFFSASLSRSVRRDDLTETENLNGTTVEERVKNVRYGIRTNVGYLYSFKPSNRLFLAVEASFLLPILGSEVTPINANYYNNFSFYRLTGGLSVGYRIGQQSKTTIEGATESNTVKIQR